MSRHGLPVDVASSSPPSEAWLFAQAVLGKPIPPIASPEARAKAEREELERLAPFSFRHAHDLSRLQLAEAEARRQRESLEWAVQVCTRAESKLRALQGREAAERESWRRAQRFYESNLANLIEWNEADHPRKQKGSPEGGQWITKDGGAGSTPSSSISDDDRSTDTAKDDRHRAMAQRIRDSDRDHDLALTTVLKKGELSVGDLVRIQFTDDEVKRILTSAQKPGSRLNLSFYTADNLPSRLRSAAEREFATLPGDEKYGMQAYVSNQRRARVILISRNRAFQQYVHRLYGFLRSLNPAHFMVEKGAVLATGKEPVLGEEASRLEALKDMLIYLAVLRGISWGISKIISISVGAEAAGDTAIGFEGGGKLTISRGAEYSPEALESAVERAASGEAVEIKAPVSRPSRPNLTEVPRISNDPKTFRRWFNELSTEELNFMWKSPALRNAIEEGLRWPKGLHEWLMIEVDPKNWCADKV